MKNNITVLLSIAMCLSVCACRGNTTVVESESETAYEAQEFSIPQFSV